MTASLSDTPKDPPSLAPLVALLATDMEQVNARIIARMTSDVPLVPAVAGHLIAAGGKRLRPLFTLAGAGLAGGSLHAVSLATAVEFIHSATLLHDDVIDESKLRRGRDTANALWGNDASVLVGDFLFARAFELMVETGNLSVLGKLSHASARITEGEIKQMTIAGAPDTPAEDYLDVIRNKTAILFAAAAASGAEVAGAAPPIIEAAHEYGLQVGMAFQIMDDAMDYSLSSNDMGKNCGDDFLDQKITLPLIIAYRNGTDAERRFWQRTIGEGTFTDGDFETACGILHRYDAIDRSVAEAVHYAHAADSALARIAAQNSANPALVDALSEAAKFAAHRQN
jgi:octaprenyl-diphosphate synthase